MEPLDPILIASAVRRSGTTLVQRLMCSSENALVFGESCAHELGFAQQLFQGKQLSLMPFKESNDVMLKDVLAGKVDDWLANLMPPVPSYLDAVMESAFGPMVYLKKYAKEAGRPLWGMKMAQWSAYQLIQLQRLFPDLKLIYIHRDLESCVSSAIRMEMIYELHEIEHFCQLWKGDAQVVQDQFPSENVLWIDYNQLVEEPEVVVDALQGFTGAKNIDVAVMEKKINTFSYDPRLQKDAEGSWLKPVSVSEEIKNIIRKYA